MSCTNCTKKVSGVCKVCQLVDGNEEVKQVVFCKTCGVHICLACEFDLTKRMKAFSLAKIKQLKQLFE